jgi:PAS domain S-box-containing protein
MPEPSRDAPPDPGLIGLLEAAEELAGLGSWQVDLRTTEVRWSRGMFRIHGLEPGEVEPSLELVAELVHPDDRERVAAGVARIGEAVDVPDALAGEYRVVRDDGATVRLHALGRLERDGEGRPARWTGCIRDVTEQRLAERELGALHAVSAALREWSTFDEGVVDLLRRLGTALELPMGALWVPDAAGERLVSRAFWADAGVEAGDFEVVTRRATFRMGNGVPGRAWRSATPLVTADLGAHLTLARRGVAEAAGLRSGLAFPAVAGDEVVAVLTFYTPERIAVADRGIETLVAIGRQLGRFLARRRGDLAPHPLSDREREVLRLAAEGNTGPEIAGRLVVSPATVKTHFENVYEKLGVGDRAAAVAHALRTGLIE